MRKPIAWLVGHRRMGSARGHASLAVIFAMELFITGCGGGGASGSKTPAKAAATQRSATTKPTPATRAR